MSLVSRVVAPTLIVVGATTAAAQAVHHGLDPANLDTTCAPCQDFYRYANGGWLARTPLPPEYASYGSFTELVERNNETLRQIVDRLPPPAGRGPPPPPASEPRGLYGCLT